MNRLRESNPIACSATPLFAITATQFGHDDDQDPRSRTLGASAKCTTPRQTSSDLSLYIMFAGKILLLVLALVRLG